MAVIVCILPNSLCALEMQLAYISRKGYFVDSECIRIIYAINKHLAIDGSVLMAIKCPLGN